MEVTTKSDPPWAGSTEPEHVTRIRILFTRLLPGRVRRIAENIDKLVDGGEEVGFPSSRSLFLEAHRLAGSAGSFGGDRLGEIAGQIDQSLRQYYDEGVLPPPEVIRVLPKLLDELRASEREFLRWMEGVEMSTDWIEEDQELEALEGEEGAS
jgi:HPt (histidine-containing phosphotransfer) domain-containing protein